MSGEDKIAQEILELIKQEANLENKAFLLVLYKLAQNTEANTKLIETLASDMSSMNDKLAIHLSDGSFNKGKQAGMRGILLPALALLQVIAISLIGFIISNQHDNTDKIATLQSNVSYLKAKIGGRGDE